MGSEQSSLANSDITTSPVRTGKELSAGWRGRKSHATDVTAQMSTTSLLSGDFEPSASFEVTNAFVIEDDTTTDDSSDLDESEEEDSDEEFEQEFQEALEERRRVLEDARTLKKHAVFYSHPEKPVEVDASVFSRCFFDRVSAPERVSVEEADERAMIMDELKALKQKAVDYAHPELTVVTTDPYACGRNFFSRASAPEQEDPEEAEERARVLADAKQLKKLAVDFAHPELSVVTTDPFACGRNYFSRPSAPEQEDIDEAEEHARVLADAKQLKKLAVDYAHPEKPLVVDAFACGRNYFSRASAPEQEDMEEAEERARVMEDAQKLKELAVAYNHPEMPVVTTDPFACGRNYFSRYGAPEQEDVEEAEERARVLDEAKMLKKLAVDYNHPENPCVTTDSFACGRNYFSRPSAPEQEDMEEAEERALILAECMALKQKAVDFAHPEIGVTTTDPFACGRNFFSRPSAPEQEDMEDAEEHARILADCMALKQKAVDFAHPEIGVTTTDSFACGRNYFSRPSAPQQEDPEEAEERARVLADCMALKQKAVDFAHPEIGVTTTDPFACGRSYFSRPSAPQQEDPEDVEERALILADAKQLKKLAVDYHHPEAPCVTTDSLACARNFFNRPSAPEQEDHDFDEERERVLEEAKQLKKLAVDYHHPEIDVETTDPFACGRNYFTRASAPEQEDLEEAEERACVLEEAKQLKKLAVDYHHPELPIETTDPCACGRNYFTRASAPEQLDPEEAEERVRILEEAKLLKDLAVVYNHPERPVMNTLVGRNYFSRYSAAGHHAMVHTFPSHEHDEHHEEHTEHFEPWGFDEDLVFDEVRHQLAEQVAVPAALKGSDEEGNLSRSPSSIMLFGGEAIYD